MGGEKVWERQAFRCLLVVWVTLWGASLHFAQCEKMGGGYRMTSIGELVDGSGIVAHLDLIEGTEIYGPDIEELRVIARYEGDDIHVHITDANTPRWEVPLSLIPRPDVKSLVGSTSPIKASEEDSKWREIPAPDSSHPMVLKYHINPFGFSVTRKSDNAMLFNTVPEEVESADGSGSKENSFNSLVFKDQYLEISTHIAEDATLYGIGEMTRPEGGLRLLPNRTYTLWATDIASYLVDIPLYSTYPIIMDMRKGAIVNGLLLMNSNGMDILYEKEFMTYKLIGGIFDFYFFAGSSPLAVVDQLTALVGRPVPFPYWSLGLHQARFGYKNVEELEHVTREYARAKLPMESMSADIDHMDNFKDFTLNPETYPEEKLRPYVDRLHRNHQKFIMILDPNVKIDDTYKTYVRGDELDVFLFNGTGNGKRYIAQVWPGPSNIPDFLHPNAEKWWTQEIADFYDVIPFDGLWLDMNEPANFCAGPNCYYPPNAVCHKILWRCCMVCDNNASVLSRWDNPPYMINNHGEKRPLYVKTIALNALHYDGSKMYDTHNLYGMTEALTTYRALQTVTKKRPFLLSRSCFTGSGSHTAHWTGDNGALWSELQGSIVSIMASGMFGMPMVGADICGFNMDTTEELCRRWIQVGAFYPFARSHSDSAATNQELFLWESVARSASHVLYWRYRMLPFWYTLMYEAHTTGAPYVRALFFTFPQDEQAWFNNHQFMLGDAVLVSPVLDENTTSVHAYFPRGVWYDLFGESPTIQAGEGSLWEDLPTPQDAINVHVRGGTIIPLQDFAMTTTQVRSTPFTLLVAFERAPEPPVLHPPSPILCDDADREHAFGHLYLDDDEQVKMTLTSGRASYIKFQATRIGSLYTLKSSVNESAYATSLGLVVDTVKVLGMRSAPQVVYLNGRAVSHVMVRQHAGPPGVEFMGLNHPLGTDLELVWSTSSPFSGQLMSC